MRRRHSELLGDGVGGYSGPGRTCRPRIDCSGPEVSCDRPAGRTSGTGRRYRYNKIIHRPPAHTNRSACATRIRHGERCVVRFPRRSERVRGPRPPVRRAGRRRSRDRRGDDDDGNVNGRTTFAVFPVTRAQMNVTVYVDLLLGVLLQTFGARKDPAGEYAPPPSADPGVVLECVRR